MAQAKPVENPSVVSQVTNAINTPTYSKPHDVYAITKATIQKIAMWFSPNDPNINIDPVRSTTGHPSIPEPWGNIPTTVEQQQLASPKNRFNLNWDLEYRVRPGFSPGNGYFAFANYGLAEFTSIGAGVANRKQFASICPPLYMPVQSIPPIGLPHDAGIVALQGLTVDNPDLQGYVG